MQNQANVPEQQTPTGGEVLSKVHDVMFADEVEEEKPRVIRGMTAEDVRQMRDEAREQLHGLSRQITETLKRGNSVLERSVAWPFDIYQATGLFPVDYKYWERPVETSVGPSRCIAMHAHAYTPSGEQIAADQVFHREVMQKAHQHAMALYLDKLHKVETQPRRRLL